MAQTCAAGEGAADPVGPAPVETAYHVVLGKLRQMPIYYPTDRPDDTVMKAFFADMDWLLPVGPDLAMGVCSFCVEHK